MTAHTPIYGWPYPTYGEPSDGPFAFQSALEAVEATLKPVSDAVGLHGAKVIGSATLNQVTLGAGGGTLGLTAAALSVPAVAWPRLILVTLTVFTSSQTTWAAYTIRSGGVNGPYVRGAIAQHAVSVDLWDAVPAGAARSYDATVTSSAAVATYASPGSSMVAVGFPA